MTKKLTIGLYIAGTLIILTTLLRMGEWKLNSPAQVNSTEKSYSAGWSQIESSWYYYGNDGKKMKGWIKDGENFYYLKDDGIRSVGKVEIKSIAYEFDPNGALICDSASSETMVPNSVLPTQEKFKSVNKYSWFEDNGNTYFKAENGCVSGAVNIDGDSYSFDKNGVMLKGAVFTASYGEKFLYGNDGKNIKYSEGNIIKRSWDCMVVTTKSSTDNPIVKLDDSHMMDINEVNSNGKIVSEKGIRASKDKFKSNVEVKGKTLYCKPMQTIELGTVVVSGTDADSSLFPNLIVSSKSSDNNIVYAGIEISLNNGFLREIHPRLLVYKPGNSNVTIDVNGTQTSFDIVVSE